MNTHMRILGTQDRHQSRGRYETHTTHTSKQYRSAAHEEQRGQHGAVADARARRERIQSNECQSESRVEINEKRRPRRRLMLQPI